MSNRAKGGKHPKAKYTEFDYRKNGKLSSKNSADEVVVREYDEDEKLLLTTYLEKSPSKRVTGNSFLGSFQPNTNGKND